MTTTTTAVMFDEEVDRLMSLCTTISQMASRIRLRYVSNPYFPREHLKYCQEELLSMSEHVEGSAIQLETLLVLEQRTTTTTRKSRRTYTREQLLDKRRYVTPNLSMIMKQRLMDVIERESQQSLESKNRSWRDIRTILA